MHTDNENIIKQLREGDKDAYIFIYRQYYKELCIYAYKFVKNIAHAEDVVQDVIFKMWNKRETININAEIKQYLYRAVRNQSLNYIRDIKKEINYKNNFSANSESVSFSDVAVENELAEKIDEALSSLPGKQREIFELNRLDGLKYREIAEKLCISIKIVEYNIYKTVNYLSEHLKDFLPILLLISTNFVNNFKET